MDPASLTAEVARECVKLYQDVLKRVYEKKSLKLPIKQALEDDKWRYTVLPVAQNKHQEGLVKSELARLVQWKITHGKYRPFLPGMIQKNSDADIKQHTKVAGRMLMEITVTGDETKSVVRKALAEVTKLNGVGPATGTLVLSVFNPAVVPFFQDELYNWLVRPGSAVKLKYDLKEYDGLLHRAFEVMNRVGIQAWELEKTAFVLEHLDVLGTEEKATLAILPDDVRQSEKPGNAEVVAVAKIEHSKTAWAASASNPSTDTVKGRKRKSLASQNESEKAENQSIRRSQRLKT